MDPSLEQQPFGAVEFFKNPEKRCPCILLLDTSGSMSGDKIAQLNEGLRVFERELKSDTLAAKRVEVAIVTFGPVQAAQVFVTADSFVAPTLSASGDTPMGAAIEEAVQMVLNRKKDYRAAGVDYFRPWIFLMTDGAPTDDVAKASALLREGDAAKQFYFFCVGVDSADMGRLASISPATSQPLKLRGLSFREMFVWLSNSLSSKSKSQPGTEVALVNPTAPTGWASV